MTPKEIKSALLQSDLRKFLEDLIPNGTVEGNYFSVGSVNGEEGKSLKVRIAGDPLGVWGDFSNSNKGDIFELIMLVKGIGFKECLEFVSEYLELPETYKPEFIRTSSRNYSIPVIPVRSGEDRVLQYLRGRGLSDDTIQKFKISSSGYNFVDGVAIPSVVFPFYDRDNNLRLVKYLGIERPNGQRFISASGNSQPRLFGWQALDRTARTLIITKGEIEAMSFHQLGFDVLATPFGEGKGKHGWLEFEYEDLEPFEEIIIHADNDMPGHATVQELSPKLGMHRCKFIYGSPIQGLKDVNDALLVGVTKEQMQKWLLTAKSCDPDALKQATAFVDDVISRFHDPSYRNKGYPFPIPSWENQVRIRMGELSIWTGLSACGKSQFIGQTALHLADFGVKSLIASLEMHASTVIGRLLCQKYAIEVPSVDQIKEGAEWMSDKILFYDKIGNVKLEDLTTVLVYAIKKFGVNFIVLDSLMKFGIHSEDYQGTQDFIDALQNLAKQYWVHIALVAHSRKKDETDNMSRLDIKGSSVLGDLPELIIAMQRNRKKEHDIQALMYTSNPELLQAIEHLKVNEHDAVISCVKQRNGTGAEPVAKCYFDPSTQLYREMS